MQNQNTPKPPADSDQTTDRVGVGRCDLFDDSSVELTPDSVRPGMHVTILRWWNSIDRSWVGDILHVVAVNPPFIVVNLRRYNGTSRMVIDTRNATLRQLTEDFVEAADVSPSTLPSNSPLEPHAAFPGDEQRAPDAPANAAPRPPIS